MNMQNINITNYAIKPIITNKKEPEMALFVLSEIVHILFEH